MDRWMDVSAITTMSASTKTNNKSSCLFLPSPLVYMLPTLPSILDSSCFRRNNLDVSLLPPQ